MDQKRKTNFGIVKRQKKIEPNGKSIRIMN